MPTAKKKRPTNAVPRDTRLASLRYNRDDAHEALLAALSMRDWNGVVKYAKQVQAYEQKLATVEAVPSGRRRFPRTEMSASDHKRGMVRTAGEKFGRGRLP